MSQAHCVETKPLTSYHKTCSAPNLTFLREGPFIFLLFQNQSIRAGLGSLILHPSSNSGKFSVPLDVTWPHLSLLPPINFWPKPPFHYLEYCNGLLLIFLFNCGKHKCKIYHSIFKTSQCVGAGIYKPQVTRGDQKIHDLKRWSLPSTLAEVGVLAGHFLHQGGWLMSFSLTSLPSISEQKHWDDCHICFMWVLMIWAQVLKPSPWPHFNLLQVESSVALRAFTVLHNHGGSQSFSHLPKQDLCLLNISSHLPLP